MDAVLQSWLETGLIWLPQRGVGYLEAKPRCYDSAYFAKYREYEATERGQAITQSRLEMVRRHWLGPMVDVGIGSGAFANAAECHGYDINPAGVDWLISHGRYFDPYACHVDAVTFWDSLEHIADPAPLLANVRQWAFISAPIYRDVEHVIASRHYRPDEHYHYWTRAGLQLWMREHGFRCVEFNAAETALGRDGIESFAFMRVA